MKHSIYLLLIIACFACNSPRPEKNCATFEELTDSAAVDPAWENVKPGLQAAVGSIDLRYPKTAVSTLQPNTVWKGSAWKGERVSAQVVLWTAEDIRQAECEFSEFKSGKNKLPADIARSFFVRYVMTDTFGNGCGKRQAGDFPSHLSADMLDNLDCFDIPAKTVRPVWITIDVPADAHPGLYEGKLTIYANGKKKQNLKLQLEVADKLLPPPSEWTYHLDLWQHPTAVARWHNVEVWSDEHYEYLRPLMKMLAGAGQKVITANLNKDPWNGQCYDRYADMILWTKKKDGSWQYDYAAFDRWVSFMTELGVGKMINCYSMVPWNNELHYKDEKKGEMITVQAIPGTPVFKEMWTPFLKDFVAHLKEKGWLEITNIAMDERSPETMKATIGLVQQVAPELGISLADNHKSYKEYPFIKDLCVSYGATIDAEDLAYRKTNGLNTTYYVCCSHPFPNQFTFSAPAEPVYAAWYAAAAGFDGFLRWAYNSWVEDPLTDSRFRTWPGGDTYLVYPEARSSIRFERLREGIQDYEKIRILRNELTDANTDESKAKLALLEQELAKFAQPVKQSETPCEEMVNSAKRFLNEKCFE